MKYTHTHTEPANKYSQLLQVSFIDFTSGEKCITSTVVRLWTEVLWINFLYIFLRLQCFPLQHTIQMVLQSSSHFGDTYVLSCDAVYCGSPLLASETTQSHTPVDSNLYSHRSEPQMASNHVATSVLY
jgi:hypothetical protein